MTIRASLQLHSVEFCFGDDSKSCQTIRARKEGARRDIALREIRVVSSGASSGVAAGECVRIELGAILAFEKTNLAAVKVEFCA